jgi:C-terminal processing protease CtpA/Prc
LASADNLIQPTRKSNIHSSGYVDTPSIIGGKSKNSDVSTLGDPIPFGVIREQHDDLSSANESCSLEYDFKKAFLDLNSITDSQICGTVDDQVSTTEMTLNDDVVTTEGLQPQRLKLMIALADDIVTTAGDGTMYSSHDGTLSMEEEYEVIVPPGLLGLILESHIGSGRPTVNSIKPDTVLSSVVQVGDYLDAVDGINVKMMSANDVSKLIVQKQEEVRILEFARPIKHKTYHL